MMIGFVFAWNVIAPLIPQDWMVDQIECELQRFENGIEQEAIAESMEMIRSTHLGESAPIIHLKFKDGRCTWGGPTQLDPEMVKRANHACKAVSHIHSLDPLEPFECLLCVDATCERPIFLRETKVPIFAFAKSNRNHQVILVPKGITEPKREGRLFLKQVPWSARKPIALLRPSALRNEFLFEEWEVMPLLKWLIIGSHGTNCIDAGITANDGFKRIPWNIRQWLIKLKMNRPALKPAEYMQFRYLIACEQLGYLPNLEWQLCSGATLLKTPCKCTEWFHSQLESLKHYVPVSLFGENALSYMEWLVENDTEAEKIAQNSYELGRDILSDQAMLSYFSELLHRFTSLYRR